MKPVVIIVSLLLAVLSVNGRLVTAQGDEWMCTVDFTEEDGGFVRFDISGQVGDQFTGVYTESVGWEDSDTTVLGRDVRGVAVQLSIDAVNITEVSLVSDTTAGIADDSIIYPTIQLKNGATAQDSITASGFGSETIVLTTDVTADLLRIYTEVSDSNTSATGTALFSSIEVSGTGIPIPQIGDCNDDELSQPLQQLNNNGHVEIIDDGEETTGLITKSNDANAVVRAIVNGTIVSIEDFEFNRCEQYFFSPQGIFGFACPVAFQGINGSAPYDVGVYDTSIVTIESLSGKRYVQIADDVSNYAVEGQTITAGCYLGKVITASDPDGIAQPLTATWSLDGSSFDSYVIDNLPQAPYPPESTACNADDGFEECVGDYDLKDRSMWFDTGTVQWSNTVNLLGNGSAISASFILDASREPELIVRQSKTTGNDQVTLQLGETGITTVFNNGKATIPAGEHQPDFGTFHTVKVKNTGAPLLQLEYVCVRHTKDNEGGDIPPNEVDPDDIDPGDPPPPDNPDENQQTCTFANNSFDDGIESWTVDSNVEGATGAINIPHNETISQDVTTTEETTLSVIASVWAYNGYDPDPTDTSTILLEYDTGSGYTTIESKTLGEYASRNNILVMQTTISTFDGTFTLRPTLTGTPSEVRGITIRSLCLNEDGEISDDEGEIEGGIFTAQCGTQIPIASGDNLFTWIPWLWAHLNKFFQCDLMILLNQMYALAVDMYNLAGWSVRYGISLADESVDWMGVQFVPWLGGYLSNISPGNVTVQQEQQCNNLFCMITTFFDFLQNIIDMISGLFDIVLGALGAILDIGLQILGVLFDFISLFQTLFEAIINSYINAPPIDIPHMPACSTNPQQNGLCIGLWMMENTIFSGTGALLIPLLISYSGIMWLLWAVKEIKKVVLETGRGL